MGDIVIAAYRPKPGMERGLLELAEDHVPLLRRLGLATDRESYVLAGRGGVIVEVFEWKEGAIALAHEHPDVLALWDKYAAVCDYVPLSDLPESKELFATFKPLSF